MPCDLHLEHLNRICKDAIQDLGVNKTEAAITRVGKALGTLSPVLDQFDAQNSVQAGAGIHRAPSSERDRDAIIRQLQQSGVFSTTHARTHRTFPRPRDVLHAKSNSEICEWIAERLQ